MPPRRRFGVKYVFVTVARDTQLLPDGTLRRVPQSDRVDKELGMMGGMP